jgi:hypothetical protein
MKRSPIVFTLIALSCALFFWSCKKNDPNNPGGGTGGSGGGGGVVILDTVDIDYTEEAEMPANAQTVFAFVPVGMYVEPDSGVFETNTDAELSNQGFTKEQVQKIYGKSLNVSITNNPTQNFDFMDTIKVHVAKKDGSEKTLFAYKYNYPLGLRSIDMDMTGDDVKDIFRSDSAKIYFGGTKRGAQYTLQGNTKIEFKTTVSAVVDVAN